MDNELSSCVVIVYRVKLLIFWRDADGPETGQE
jgi:hypothetical protein